MNKNKSWKFIENGYSPLYNVDFVFLYCPSLKCNYRCYYCYQQEWEKQIVTEEKYDKQKEFIHHIEKLTQGKKRGMDLYGGEFLINVDIFKFFNEFYDKWDKFRLFTNLSEFIQLFKELSEFDKLGFVISFHPTEVKDVDKFIDKLDLLQKRNKSIELRIMFDKNQRDKILKVVNYILDKNIFFTFRNIYDFEYDEKLYKELKQKYDNEDHKIEYQGRVYKLREFLDLNVSSFMIKCSAGNKELVLDPNGDVYPCETLQLKSKGKLLNIYNDDFFNFKLLKEFYCPLKQCRCDWFMK